MRVPVGPYRLAQRAVRTVSAECWVHFEGSRYSVPPAQVGLGTWFPEHTLRQAPQLLASVAANDSQPFAGFPSESRALLP